MGIIRDLYVARKISAGAKLPAPTVALLIKRLALAAAMGGGGGDTQTTVRGNLPLTIANAIEHAIISLKQYGLVTQLCSYKLCNLVASALAHGCNFFIGKIM